MIRRRKPIARSTKPIRRGAPPKRTKPPNKRRAAPRRGKATTADKRRVRGEVYARSGGICELGLSDKCVPSRLPWSGGVFERGHLVHLKSEGSGGATDLDNCRFGCWYCHLVSLHQEGGKGKIIPKKVRQDATNDKED